MSDKDGFSDDISAAWGPEKESVLSRVLPPRAVPSRPVPLSQVEPGHLDALERQLHDRLAVLAERLTEELARRTELLISQAVAEQAARIRSETIDDLTRHIAEVEARIVERLDAIEGQPAGELLDASRLQALEIVVHEMAEVARGHDGALPADELRVQLFEAVESRLALMSAEVAEAAAANLDAGEREMNDRLDAIDDIARRMLSEATRAAALAPSASSVLAPIRSDIIDLRSQLDALTNAVAELSRNGGARRPVKRVTKSAAPPATRNRDQ